MNMTQLNACRLGVYVLCFFDNAQNTFGTTMYAAVLLLSLVCIRSDAVEIVTRFAPIVTLGAIYIVVSLVGVLPSSWTVFYRIEAIPSQANWLLGLPLISLLSYFYTKNVLYKNSRREFKIVSVLMLFNLVFSGVLAENSYSFYSYGPFGYLWSPLCVYFLVSLWCILINRDSGVLLLFLFQALAALSLASGSQTKVAYLIALSSVVVLNWFPRFTATIILSVVIFVVATYVFSLSNIEIVYESSPDIGIRALMLKNAIIAAYQTGFVGVGFGTESIMNEYPEVGVYSFNWINDAFILIGVHNAFAEVFMKMGVPGLAALVYTIYNLCVPGANGDTRTVVFRRTMLALIILNLSFNVGLQSAFHMAGVAIMLGGAYAAAPKHVAANTRSRLPRRARNRRIPEPRLANGRSAHE